MNLVIRTSELNAVKRQLSSALKLIAEDIIALITKNNGITLLNFNESTVSSFCSIHYIKAPLLDEAVAIKLLQPKKAGIARTFETLAGLGALEQYEHFSQLHYNQKTVREKI